MLDQLEQLIKNGKISIYHNGHRVFDLEIKPARKGEVNIGFMGNKKTKTKYQKRLALTNVSKHLKDIIN